MQISISGHQLDVTEALKSYVTEKVDRIERHAEHITKVEITLTVEKSRQKRKATSTLPVPTFTPQQNMMTCTQPLTRWPTNSIVSWLNIAKNYQPYARTLKPSYNYSGRLTAALSLTTRYRCMQLSDIITPERVVSSLKGASKKRVLELAAEFIAEEAKWTLKISTKD